MAESAWIASSQPVAGHDVAHRQGEEDEADREHDGVQHGMLLAARADSAPSARILRSATASVDRGQGGEAILALGRCQPARMFSRRTRLCLYRKSIKTGRAWRARDAAKMLKSHEGANRSDGRRTRGGYAPAPSRIKAGVFMARLYRRSTDDLDFICALFHLFEQANSECDG